ncbi:MAG: hypothetical protein CL872_06600 [Dehalococcoidaceae bacterium]|nr:hypothetical protein [Dehalococcoidaceae bacterium]
MKQAIIIIIVSFLLIMKFLFNSPKQSNDELLFFANYAQLFALVLSIAIALLIIYFYDFLESEILIFLFFAINLLLLMALGIDLLGREEYGSTRRIYLTNEFSIQPSEILKFSILLATALLYKKFYDKQLLLIILLLAIYIIPIILIQLQPNTSTALLFSAYFTVAIFICGVTYRALFTMFLSMFALLPMVITFFVAEYQFGRFSAFANPQIDPLGLSYIPSLVNNAVNRNGFIGPGTIEQVDSFLFNVLAADSDFALAVIIEQLGLIALLLIIIAFIFILWTGTSIALNSANRFQFLSTILATYIIVIQAMLHIMVNLSLLPTTGTTLPFVSNGSNALLINFALIGIIIGTERKNKTRSKLQKF